VDAKKWLVPLGNILCLRVVLAKTVLLKVARQVMCSMQQHASVNHARCKRAIRLVKSGTAPSVSV
jgi:hypothetical protein